MMPLVNIEAEQALLGACLVNADAMDTFDGIVRPEDFSEPVHVLLFDAFTRARAEGRRIDVSLMRAVLGQDAKVRLVEGATVGEYIAMLASDATTVLNAPDYARVVSETANYRRLMLVGEDLKTRAASGYSSGSPSELASSAIAELDAVASAGATRARRISVTEAVEAAAEAADERANHGVEHGVTWGLTDLDRVTKLFAGELTILAARPSMGKTTLGLSTCLAAARSGEGVLFFSLEMGGLSLGQRVLSDMLYDDFARAPVPYSDIRDGKLPEGAGERIRDAIEKLNSLPLLIEQEAGLTVSQIVARSRTGQQKLETKYRSHLGLIVVDHLGLIAAADRYAGARHLELGAMTNALKCLAKDMAVPVLLLCQLSRGVESRENKRPMLSDLRESGRIEEDADTVVLLYREAYYLERLKETDPEKDAERMERLRHCQTVLEINVAKQRQGATRTVEAFVSMPSNAVRNLSRGAW